MIRPLRRGLTLTEMLFVLMIVSFTLILEGRLFHASLKTIQFAPQAQRQDAVADQMSRTFRKNLWGASRIDQPDPRTLVLGYPDNTTLRWEFSEDGSVKRTTGGADESALSWKLSAAIMPERRGAAVVLRTSSNRYDESDLPTFISQLMLANGGQP